MFRPVDELTELALAASDGDRLALGAFIRRAHPAVWQLCARLTDPSLADDMTQEVFVRAWQGLGRFRQDSTAQTWVLGIAYLVCAEQWRRDRRQLGIQRRLQVRARTRRAQVSDHAERVVLEDLLGSLGNERRAALVLTQILGLSYAEAAEVCRCEVGTIRSRVARARAQLVDLASERANPPIRGESARNG